MTQAEYQYIGDSSQRKTKTDAADIAYFVMDLNHKGILKLILDAIIVQHVNVAS